MPVVSQSILKDNAQDDGRRTLVFLYTDDLGNDIIYHRGRVSSGLDADAELLAYVNKMDDILQSEFNHGISDTDWKTFFDVKAQLTKDSGEENGL